MIFRAGLADPLIATVIWNVRFARDPLCVVHTSTATTISSDVVVGEIPGTSQPGTRWYVVAMSAKRGSSETADDAGGTVKKQQQRDADGLRWVIAPSTPSGNVTPAPHTQRQDAQKALELGSLRHTRQIRPRSRT